MAAAAADAGDYAARFIEMLRAEMLAAFAARKTKAIIAACDRTAFHARGVGGLFSTAFFLTPLPDDVIEYIAVTEEIRLPAGSLPLHAVISSSYGERDDFPHTLALQMAVLRACPAAAAAQDSAGSHPLHLAVSSLGMSGDFIKAVLAAHPAAAAVADAMGDLPLALAVENLEVDSAAVIALLEAFPAAASTRDSQGRLPLHLFMSSRSSHEIYHLYHLDGVLLHLLDAYPGAAAVPFSDSAVSPLFGAGAGHFPLHRAAAMCGASATAQLLASNPAAAAAADADGFFPLNYAAQFSLDDEVGKLLMLIAAHPAALSARTSRGDLPLHIALLREPGSEDADNGADFALELLRADPAAALVASSGGALPLLLATCSVTEISGDGVSLLIDCAARKKMASLLEELIDAHPAALATPSADGILPLHEIARMQESDATTREDCEDCLWAPALASRKDSHFSRTPYNAVRT